MLSIEYMSVMVICPTGRANDGSILADKKQWYPVFLDLTERISKENSKLNLKLFLLMKVMFFGHIIFRLHFIID